MKTNYILLLLLLSCQGQTHDRNILANKNENSKEYIGEWFFVDKKDNGEYFYCDDISKSIRVNDDSIVDHTTMEDSNFKIDHIKKKNDIIFLYLNKEESSFYKFQWISKEQGISKWTFGAYDGTYYIIKKNLGTIKKILCDQENEKSECELKGLSSKFNFTIKGLEFEDEKEKKKPVSVLITITDKQNLSQIQEIRFEPYSWVLFDDIPCEAFTVKDFNFDGLDDFAFIWDNGGDSGPVFSYFFQNNKGEFIEDLNFPLNHSFLPKELNKKDKTLTISGAFGCCKIFKTVFQLKTDKWVVIHSEEKEK